jgi:hypothetical protein
LASIQKQKPLCILLRNVSNSLSNVIIQALDYIIGSISSFFSRLFGSKEKESNQHHAQQSDDNLSLLKFETNELDHDVRNHLLDNHSLLSLA